jgi:hypothetical protein
VRGQVALHLVDLFPGGHGHRDGGVAAGPLPHLTVNLSNVTNPAQTFFVFSAALFQVQSGSSKTHTALESILAGTYEAYPPGAVAASTGRWVASLSQKVKEKDKEEKEKEQSKDAKDIPDKSHKDAKDIPDHHPKGDLPDRPQFSVAGDPAALLGQLTLRVDAIEQRLATGQPFIGAEERPEVGGQALQDRGEE